MTRTQARRWAFAAAVAGLTADALFIAFYVGFALQHFAEPYGVAAVLGSAADYAGIPQNALLAVTTGVVFRFLSHQRRFDRVLEIAGATAFTVAAAGGVPTVTGLLPGVSSVAVGGVLAATVWLLAIGIRGTRLPDPRRARAARLVATTMLGSGVLALTGVAIGVAWAGLIAGALAWLSIPIWLLALTPSRATAQQPSPEPGGSR